jgi:ankyrin repeat protein
MKNRIRVGTVLALGLLFAVGAASACEAGGWKSHESPLIVAAKNGDIRQVRALLSTGASIDERDEFSERTALMRAAEIGNVEIVRQLLKSGADATLKDDDGLTALMIAKQSGNADVIEALRNAEARLSARVRAAKTVRLSGSRRPRN